MRKNEYNSLSEFVNEYSGKQSEVYETYIGLDFEYKNSKYRMCLEPIQKYYLYVVHTSNNSDMPEFDTIGIFDTLELLLDSTKIDNRPFRDVIMDDSTIITGKD